MYVIDIPLDIVAYDVLFSKSNIFVCYFPFALGSSCTNFAHRSLLYFPRAAIMMNNHNIINSLHRSSNVRRTLLVYVYILLYYGRRLDFLCASWPVFRLFHNRPRRFRPALESDRTSLRSCGVHVLCA